MDNWRRSWYVSSSYSDLTATTMCVKKVCVTGFDGISHRIYERFSNFSIFKGLLTYCEYVTVESVPTLIIYLPTPPITSIITSINHLNHGVAIMRGRN